MADGIAIRFDGYVAPDPRAGTPSYAAADERQLSTVLAGPGGALLARAGIRPGPGGSVAVGGSPEAVTIQPFSGIVTDPAGGGSYIFVIPSAVTKNFTGRPGTGQSRIDELVVKILNDVPRPADAAREVDLQLIAGTAAASPGAPSIPAGQLQIREFTVPASGAIAVAKTPPRIAALGGIFPVVDQTERDALTTVYDGLLIYREDNGTFEGRIAGTWTKLAAADTGWQNLTGPLATAGGTLRYRRRGDTVFAQVDGSVTTTSASELTLNTALIPTALRPSVVARGGAYFSTQVGLLSVYPDGTIKALQTTGANRTSVSGIVSWPVEA